MLHKPILRASVLAILVAVAAVEAAKYSPIINTRDNALRSDGGCCAQRAAFCDNRTSMSKCVDYYKCAEDSSNEDAEDACVNTIFSSNSLASFCGNNDCASHKRRFCGEKDNVDLCKKYYACRGSSNADCTKELDPDDKPRIEKVAVTLCEGGDYDRCESEAGEFCADATDNSCTKMKECAEKDSDSSRMESVDCDNLDSETTVVNQNLLCDTCEDQRSEMCKELGTATEVSQLKKESSFIKSCKALADCIYADYKDDAAATVFKDSCEDPKLSTFGTYCKCGLEWWEITLIAVGGAIFLGLVGAAVFFFVLPRLRK